MDQRRVPGAVRLLRGVLAAVLAVAAAALAHSAAGHHNPHPVVLICALAISVPVCVALSSVRLSRLRLSAAVLSSQAVLHGLFALFPASGTSSVRPAGGGHGHQHHHHHQHLILDTAHQHHSTVVPDGAMAVSHILADGLTYLLLRRGELVLAALSHLLSIRPAMLLAETPVAVPGRRAQPAAPTQAPLLISDLWPGAGRRTLRGPPVVVN